MAELDALLNDASGVALSKWILRICEDKCLDRPWRVFEHLGHRWNQTCREGLLDAVDVHCHWLHA